MIIPGLRGTLLSLALVTNGYAACSLDKYGELPVVMNGRQPTIEGSINGIPATFLADSGAFYSVLWADRVGRFNLRLEHPPGGLELQGVRGKEGARATTIQDFALRGFGGGVIHKVQFLVAGQALTPLDGNIGQNILGRADTEYDLGNGVIRLYHSTGCENSSLAYWHGTAPVSEMRIRPTSVLEPHIIGSAKLNGLDISVFFDSGATYSMLSLKAAVRAGFDPTKATSNTSSAFSPIGKGELETWLTRFDDLDLGGEDIKHVQLRVGDVLPGGPDLILGVDFFLSHRIYVAQSQHNIYFTYNGGPIFDVPDASSSAASPEAAAVPGNQEAGGSPEDAAQFMRRGAASAARGDLPSAIADFDAAIRLNPDDAESYYRRGNAKMQLKQFPGAREDFDRALRLQPQNAMWLNMRGVLRVLTKDDQGATADFDAAARLAPEEKSVDLTVAAYLAQFGQFDAAIGRLDQWIDAHPKEAELPIALNWRCWYRAQLGKELEKALADCDESLKLKPNIAEALDSRALVYLRLGNNDKSIADYQVALRSRPREAWSLYGLGLAQLRKGLQTESIKNMQKALAIDSGIAEQFRKIGLTP